MSTGSLAVFFETEADTVTGIGHFVRCCALGAALDRLTRCSFYFDQAFVDGARDTMAVDRHFRSSVSAIQHLDERVLDVTVTDLPGEAPQVDTVRSRCRLRVQIVDEIPSSPDADLLICPNIVNGSKSVASVRSYGGRLFIILHPAYDQQIPSPIHDSVQRILICFGGSDPANVSLRLTRLLEPVGTLQYRLVLGSHHVSPEVVRVSAIQGKAGIEILRGLHTLAEEVARCDMVIISGGTILYEACAMGRPAIVLSQNDLQAEEAEYFSRQGGVVHLGRHDLVSDDWVRTTLHGVLSDHNRRRDLSEKAKTLVPLGGAKRVAEQILNQLR